MEIFTSKKRLTDSLNDLRNKGQRIGFVPTMGALHEGHISLVKKAKSENDIVVVSIFVNPTQFNNQADLEKYPRLPEKDIPMLKAAGGDFLFMPDVVEMYPEGTAAVEQKLDLGKLGEVMEGEHRPGHFDGVVRVVRKLFEITGKCRAYFGEKDFQQLAVVRFLVKQESIPVEIVGCPIVREPDGLAMSSRNMRLSENERQAAVILSKALFEVKEKWNGLSRENAIELAKKHFASQPEVRLEYFEIADCDSLQPAPDSQKKNVVACVAAFAGEIRLIDNVRLG